jgi:hypothetical protein
MRSISGNGIEEGNSQDELASLGQSARDGRTTQGEHELAAVLVAIRAAFPSSDRADGGVKWKRPCCSAVLGC